MAKVVLMVPFVFVCLHRVKDFGSCVNPGMVLRIGRTVVLTTEEETVEDDISPASTVE